MIEIDGANPEDRGVATTSGDAGSMADLGARVAEALASTARPPDRVARIGGIVLVDNALAFRAVDFRSAAACNDHMGGHLVRMYIQGHEEAVDIPAPSIEGAKRLLSGLVNAVSWP